MSEGRRETREEDRETGKEGEGKWQ